MLILFLSLRAFSQVAELNKNGDTVICFSINRAKFLAKEHYRADAYYKSDSICKSQVKEKDQIINMYKKIEDKHNTMIENQKNVITLKNEQIKELELNLQLKDKEIKRQKLYKYISIASGAALTGYLGYKYITK